MLNEYLYKSDNSKWETPDDLFNALNDHYHFTIDLCADKNNHKLDNYYGEEQDALSKNWEGICWMNPPYGKDISKWVEKAYNSKGAIVVCLLPVRSDTKWWHKYCMNGEIKFINKRLKFKNSNNMATFPSALVIFGNCNAGEMSTFEYPTK